jgi:alkylresorcinol/alkylpyrone synthase
VGTSLFADGVACALVSGLEAELSLKNPDTALPRIEATQSMLMPNAEDVMGWNIRNEGFFVIFSKDIPTIIRTWVQSNVQTFLEEERLTINDIQHFVAHPGGKKVLEAYVETFGIGIEKINHSLDILTNFGNMSSATILYVLKKFLEDGSKKGDIGLAAAVGPGFSSELLLLRWE